ncbi:hypothetical protein L202_02669 [Cryptococcus amylolentus CBS 6039]|uniref:Glycoside hydrolase family 5 domain-containing protein n=1 Tax=Cryptococcus amylolentus CBS 6039 TaxID=1295533 RepID=A0A1E3HVT2_9TREE|nr:hypothetical protein L202_02669 [Cryptococcus amylolentus CBS 6039]ODN80420.1 hypothetical protein L202_02669 [Cryptococcus amylolentus CBS 6039]
MRAPPTPLFLSLLALFSISALGAPSSIAATSRPLPTASSSSLSPIDVLEASHRGAKKREVIKRAQLAPGFTWGTDPMRGVNIGGWLVLEPWITPSLFENKPDWVVDEWTYGEYMKTQNNTMDEIRSHWNNWFKYAELEDIAASGLNTIRIQIGCMSAGRVLVTGADMPQTGQGIRDSRQWFSNTTNLDRTYSALSVLTSEFTQSFYNSTVVAIELINEPFPYNAAELDVLKGFYQGAYGTVRGADQKAGGGGNDVVVAIDEGFQGLTTWESFMQAPDYQNVAMDTHIYMMFDLDLIAMGYTESLDWYCGQASFLNRSNNVHWTIVGEFVPANTDCAYWLNGRGRGARYDNTLNTSASLEYPGDCSAKTGADPSGFSDEYVQYLAKSFEVQTWVYEQASGWVMWTWKTERAADWSMQTGITYGWIPTPIYSKPHG